MNSDEGNQVEYLLCYPTYEFPPFGPSIPFKKKMGIIANTSDANNGNIICMYPLNVYPYRIPYHFSAGQGNELNLKKNDEIEFELIPTGGYCGTEFEATNIERLRHGSLMYEFKPNIANQDRDQGTILELAEPGVTGKIEYRNRDTCLYLDFEVHDIIDLKFFRSDDSNKPEPLRRGQKVDFFYAKKKLGPNQKNISHVAKFIIPYGAQRFKGQVCSLKSGYGFIKRLNVDKEIFFHITQVQNGTSTETIKDGRKVQVGDKVDFSIGFHDDREVASQINVLPKNFPMEFDTIKFDPISRQILDYNGKIIKPCDKSNLDQPGVILIEDGLNRGDKIFYYERDRQNSFTLLEHDKVIYNKAIDKRSQKERAINIRLCIDKITEKREKGIVAAVKGSYGFIKRDKTRLDRKMNQESRIFFHSSEILDISAKSGRRRIKMGNEVQFSVLPDPIPKSNQRGRCHATRIVHLKPAKADKPHKKREQEGTQKVRIPVASETSETMFGFIETVAHPDSPGIIRLKKHMGSGEGPTEAIPYSFEMMKQTIEDNINLEIGEKGNYVKFHVSRHKSGVLNAINVQRRYSGRVKLIKDSFGFVLYKDDELFFHSSETSDFDHVHKDDIVEFCIRYNERSARNVAYDVTRLKKRLSLN
jgi:cold shock CspA family protein